MPKKAAPIKLVFFSFGILEQGGGFEYFLMSTADDLSKRYDDFDITVVTMTPRIVEKLQHILTIYFMRKQDPKAIYRETRAAVQQMLGKAVYKQADSIKELAHILQQADVIYSKNEVLELAVLNKIGLKKLPPVVLGVHTPIYYPNTPSLSSRLHNFLYTGPLYRYFIKRVNRIQVNNQDDAKIVQNRLGFANVKRIRQAFAIPPLSQKETAKDTLHLLFVGRLTEAKGIGLLIQIIEQLTTEPRIKNFTFKIAGSGDAAFEEQIKRAAGASPSIYYLGHVPNDDVMKLYDEADIVIITSEYETLNKVAIEAATAGKIALCTDIPGPREVILHQKTGFLLQPKAEDFIEQIIALQELKETDPKAFNKIGTLAHAYVKQKYDPDEVYAELRQDLLAAMESAP